MYNSINLHIKVIATNPSTLLLCPLHVHVCSYIPLYTIYIDCTCDHHALSYVYAWLYSCAICTYIHTYTLSLTPVLCLYVLNSYRS